MIFLYETYVVKKGDTLYGISNQFGVSVTELASLNGVNAYTLQIGQVLKIPSRSGINPDNLFLYTVQKGDTLYSIAKKYGVSVSSIQNLNYLTSPSLSIGQVLRIPEIYTKEEDMFLPQYINYTVKKGDTLYSIANQFGITVDILMQDNGMVSNDLKIGQNLKIRSQEGEVEECFGEEYSPEDSLNSTSYVVKPGDSLYSIAKKYGITVSDLMNYNDLNTSFLSIGQKLFIPSSNTYVVKKGDTLYSIARQFGVSVESLKNKNALTTNTLSVGQVLRV